jgi:hypothetical protein
MNLCNISVIVSVSTATVGRLATGVVDTCFEQLDVCLQAVGFAVLAAGAML